MASGKQKLGLVYYSAKNYFLKSLHWFFLQKVALYFVLQTFSQLDLVFVCHNLYCVRPSATLFLRFLEALFAGEKND